MFDKVSQVAEKLASNVSRRHFIGSLGRWAGATALAMAAVLSMAPQPHGRCQYLCPDGTSCSKGSCGSNKDCSSTVTCRQMTCGITWCL
jgi:hypothetical protein